VGIAEFLERFIHNSALVTFLVAMIPVLELRASIPVGVALGLHPLAAYGLSVLGNLVPVPFIVLFIRPLFDWMKAHMPKFNGFIARMEAKAESKREMIRKWQLLGLAVLVAVPLPGTGAWTGALIAALLDIRIRRAFPAIAAGVAAAGIIVSLLTFGVSGLFA
jgi:uncharacterized membrane protein